MFVVDLDDYKWDDDHPFIKKFGKGDYHKKFDTFVQQSAGGAWHLFFNYDDEFFNKCHHGTGIDILSDRDEQGTYKGKYVVGAGTTIRFTDDMRKKYNSTANYGTYKILNDRPFSDCPDELKQWLRDFIYVDKDVVRKKKERSNKQEGRRRPFPQRFTFRRPYAVKPLTAIITCAIFDREKYFVQIEQ